MSDRSKFQTLVFIDLETTGLMHEEPKITELAMIAVNIATLEEMKMDEELPRVLNKFVKFFDPAKLLPANVVELTGLNNRMLTDYAPFNRETVIAMEAFLNDFQKPICFVAHNGNHFDFPILFNEIKSALSNPSFYTNTNSNVQNVNKECTNNDHSSETDVTVDNHNGGTLPDAFAMRNASVQTITSSKDYDLTSLYTISCADSLIFFREMHQLLNDKDIVQYSPAVSNHPAESSSCSSTAPPKTESSSRIGYVELPIQYIPSKDPARQQPSMKLSKIYEREFNRTTTNLKSHRAEDDCLMLLAVLKRYLPDWLEWIELNHKSLSNFSSLTFTAVKQTFKKPSTNTKRPLQF